MASSYYTRSGDSTESPTETELIALSQDCSASQKATQRAPEAMHLGPCCTLAELSLHIEPAEEGLIDEME